MSKLWCFGDSFTAGHGCKHFGPVDTIGTDNETYYQKIYKNYIDETKKIWPEIVADHFGFELKNMGLNGLCNEAIADYILKEIPNISTNDYVVIQTSTPGRFNFPFLKEKSLFGGFKKLGNEQCKLIYGMENSPYFLKTIFATNIQKEWNEELANSLKYTNLQENIGNKSLILNKNIYNLIRNFFSEFIATEKYYEVGLWRLVTFSNLLSNIGIKNVIVNENYWPVALDKPDNLIEMHEGGISGYIINYKQTIKYETSSEIDDTHPGYTGHISIANHIIKYIEK